ncbi:MAG: hypothetical protein H6811_06440 [Phycisphaeraceae bacterium]|nr:hypothetical protein [Phycisphaeraceae bacterium]
MPQHTVRQGECVSSLAEQSGLFWETLWEHPENAELKRLREDPNALLPGDLLEIPEIRVKELGRAVDQRHRFRKKGVPALFRVQMLLDGEPRADEAFQLEIDGVRVAEGKTDSRGMIEGPIPPDARQGTVILGEGDIRDVFTFQLGRLDPADTESGVRQRLLNLGFDAEGENLSAAIGAFQHLCGLTQSGQIDEATSSRLESVHDFNGALPQEPPG